MPTEIEPVDPKAAYADLLEQLRLLSRDMLLAFRLQVGKILLDRFFDGNVHDYRNHSGSKDTSFAAFVRTCPTDLTDLGLGGQVARQCINARVTYDMLPASVRDGLLFSHVVELARLGDPTTRARLAMDTTLQKWSVDQLKDAIGQVHQGNYYDTDSATPGTQPPEPKDEPEKKAQPGRLVARLERAVEDLDVWQAEWQAADTERLRGPQRERFKKALTALKAKVLAMEGALG
jgi:hypothetical protein